MKINRKNALSIAEFTGSFLIKNKPVIVTDAMNNWSVLDKWTPAFFRENFSDTIVQLYDDLFNFQGVTTLTEYITTYFHHENLLKSPPYVRAYCQFKSRDFFWANEIFEKIKTDWSLPYFLPTTQYLLPNTFNLPFKPQEQAAPAKGLFISAKNCLTNLHYDPWQSDAVLCQIYGKKKLTLYAPTKNAYIFQDQNKRFAFREPVDPDYEDSLSPGEILFIPHGWLHHVQTITDSISLTWNFVHSSNGQVFKNYIKSHLSLHDQEVMDFFQLI